MDIAELLTALPHLSSAEVKTVYDRCAALLTLGPHGKEQKVDPAQEAFCSDLYVAIADLLYERTKARCMPYGVFVKHPGGARYLRAGVLALAANDKWFPNQTKVERLSIIRLYARLVLDHTTSRGMPAVWERITASVENLPAIVDAAFPGYAENGMLGKVHLLRTKGKEQKP